MELSCKSICTRVAMSLALSTSISTVYAATISDLFITEVMANPDVISDANGEWFELFNPTTEAINLSGFYLKDAGSDSHLIGDGNSIVINPEQYFVFARNGVKDENGGVIADYEYSGFQLGNGADEIIFADIDDNNKESILLRLDYYNSGFVQAGNSRQLASLSLAMLQENYLLAPDSDSYHEDNVGTPGAALSPVPIPAAALLFFSGLLTMFGFAKHSGKTRAKYRFVT
jgi:hypothetical protein